MGYFMGNGFLIIAVWIGITFIVAMLPFFINEKLGAVLVLPIFLASYLIGPDNLMKPFKGFFEDAPPTQQTQKLSNKIKNSPLFKD